MRALLAAVLAVVLLTPVPAAAAPPEAVHSDWHRFAGMNIKGTPAMRASAVRHDLATGQQAADVLALQEFRWPWYWTTARRLAGPQTSPAWRSAPGYRYATSHPVYAGQPVLWDGTVWQRVETRVLLAHPGAARISEDRYLRAVLLRERATGLHAWFLSTHFVVGGDQAGDPARRQGLLAADLRAFDRFLTALTRTGHPVIGQLDANIRAGGPAYPVLMATFGRHDAAVWGEHGVEYLFTVSGSRARVQVKRHWRIGVDRLHTDHEGRGLAYRLEARP